jgi:hypothetical protein
MATPTLDHRFNRSQSSPVRDGWSSLPRSHICTQRLGFRLPLYACPVSPDTVVISRAAYTPVAVADKGRLKIPFRKDD